MDYLGILKKAYEITIKNKFLWVFGLLGGGYGGIRLYNFSPSNAEVEKIFSTQKLPDFGTYFSSHAGVLIPLISAGALLALILFVLNIISQGALISSVAKLGNDQKSDFNDGFLTGAKNFWRLLAVGLLFTVAILVACLVWIGPAALLISGGEAALGMIWGVLIFFVFIAFVVAVAVVSPYSFRILVLKKARIGSSIRQGLHFCRDNWANVLVIYLLLLAIGIGYGMAVTIALIMVLGILTLFGFLFFLIAPVAAFIYALAIGLVVLVLLLAIAGGYGAFASSVITLTYQRLTDK